MRSVVHVTHEAVQKVGGIGAVLEGLLTSPSYSASEQRDILLGPLFTVDGAGDQRLGPNGEVLYSSVDGITRHPVSEALERVRREYHVGIVYGHRRYVDPHSGAKVNPEVVLIDVSRMDLERVNLFKSRLWQAFGIDSQRYEHSWEFDLYVKLADPALAILRALGAADGDNDCVILAHEFMGMPTALAGKMDPSGAFRSIFYAHEVSAMRKIVEEHPGHDVSFYNTISTAIEQGQYVSDLFGPQHGYHRHALVDASRYCDRVFAVGDYVVKEMRFIGPHFADANIDTVYNGIPAERISLAQKRASGARLRRYAGTLLGDEPDYVFTHVTRNCTSKGLWRDLEVLDRMEREFRVSGQTAVLFVLSTEMPARSPADIRHMERSWGWPVVHREHAPDLSHGEALFYQGVQRFNARSRNIKVVYINQFGFDRTTCGERMPEDMEFLDIRRGSDVEFGMSVYEPFGIAHLESLTFGAVCVVTNVCGCAGFAESVSAGNPSPNVLVADFTEPARSTDMPGLLALTREQRTEMEQRVADRVAGEVLRRLPRNDDDAADLLKNGYELAARMSWEVVARERVLPGIEAVCRKRKKKTAAA